MEDFRVFHSVKDIKDSMQFDSDTKICEYTDGDIVVKVCVVGDVRVLWKDESCPYKYPSEFPQELKDIIAEGKLWELNGDILDIGNNNWFEAFVYSKNGDEFEFSDVVDIEGNTDEELKDMCRELAKCA